MNKKGLFFTMLAVPVLLLAVAAPALADDETPPRFEARVGGQVSAIDGGNITASTRRGEPVVLHTDAETRFVVPGVDNPGLDDIAVGNLIAAGGAWNDDGSLQAAVVIVPREAERRARIQGEVTAISGETLTLQTRRERTIDVLTDAETRFVVPGVTHPTLDNLQAGDQVAVGVQMRNGSLYAHAVAVLPDAVARLNGEVGAIESDTLLLETRYGAVQVLTGADTVFRIGGEEAALGDVQVGDEAQCAGEWQSESSFRAMAVAVPLSSPADGRAGALHGRAVSVSTDRLTVGTLQGLATVLVDAETTIVVPGVPDPALADVAVGDPVAARGVWNGNQELAAGEVRVLNPTAAGKAPSSGTPRPKLR